MGFKPRFHNVSRSAGVFTCSHVWEDNEPVLYVIHEGDGDWQFLCGGSHSDSEPILLHLEHLLERDRSINELADLGCSHSAERTELGQAWTIVDESEKKLVDNIAEYGWHVIKVFDPDGGPSFAYSVGMTETLDHPEVIIIGLGVDLMHHMINDIGTRIRSGESLESGQPIEGLLEGALCILYPVTSRHLREYFAAAYHHYGGAYFGALQCFWPGKVDGCFPWEPNCSEFVRDVQLNLRS